MRRNSIFRSSISRSDMFRLNLFHMASAADGTDAEPLSGDDLHQHMTEYDGLTEHGGRMTDSYGNMPDKHIADGRVSDGHMTDRTCQPEPDPRIPMRGPSPGLRHFAMPYFAMPCGVDALWDSGIPRPICRRHSGVISTGARHPCDKAVAPRRSFHDRRHRVSFVSLRKFSTDFSGRAWFAAFFALIL